MLTESKHFSKVIWGGALLLLFVTIVMPRIDISLQFDSPRADANPDPFVAEVHQLHELYRQDRLADATRAQALEFAPMLKARALSEAGPIDPNEIRLAAEYIRDYRPQLASQSDPAARETLRNHRNEMLLEQLPRLDKQAAIATLDAVRAAYIDQLDVDPSATAE